MLAIFAFLSVFFTVIAGPNYLADIIKRRTKPHRMTWLIFSLIATVAFISQVAIGGRWSVIFTAVDAFGSISTFILSIHYGVGGWMAPDKVAFSLAATGILLSLIVHSPVVALSGAILADACAVVLTVRKAYVHPETESTWVWLSIATGASFSALAVGAWNFQLLLFPVYLAIASISIPVAKLIGKRSQRLTAA